MLAICVYLGAKPGKDPQFTEAVTYLGQEIVQHNWSLIYGGSSLGLMGLLANTVKKQGGKAIGIITKQLINQEQPLASLDELHIVNSMHERKHLMQQKADLFLVMPGGLGTLEEAFDTWNAIKIGLFNKPIGFLNINGYFDDLFSFIANSAEQGFISPKQCSLPIISADIKQLLMEMKAAINQEST